MKPGRCPTGLVLRIYRLTREFPADERYGLTSQMRRAAVSVPANIAEGFKRRGLKDKLHFYIVSQGSLEEVRYYLILAAELAYIAPADDLHASIEQSARLLGGLIESTERRIVKE